MSRQALADAKEEEIRQRISTLGHEEKQAFYAATTKNLKDPDTYAVLNWLFIAGLHHFYLNKTSKGLINLSIFLLSLIGLVVSISTAYSTGIWIFLGLEVLISLIELPQLFMSQVIVQEYNNALMEKALANIHQPINLS